MFYPWKKIKEDELEEIYELSETREIFAPLNSVKKFISFYIINALAGFFIFSVILYELEIKDTRADSIKVIKNKLESAPNKVSTYFNGELNNLRVEAIEIINFDYDGTYKFGTDNYAPIKNNLEIMKKYFEYVDSLFQNINQKNGKTIHDFKNIGNDISNSKSFDCGELVFDLNGTEFRKTRSEKENPNLEITNFRKLYVYDESDQWDTLAKQKVKENHFPFRKFYCHYLSEYIKSYSELNSQSEPNDIISVDKDNVHAHWLFISRKNNVNSKVSIKTSEPIQTLYSPTVRNIQHNKKSVIAKYRPWYQVFEGNQYEKSRANKLEEVGSLIDCYVTGPYTTIADTNKRKYYENVRTLVCKKDILAQLPLPTKKEEDEIPDKEDNTKYIEDEISLYYGIDFYKTDPITKNIQHYYDILTDKNKIFEVSLFKEKDPNNDEETATPHNTEVNPQSVPNEKPDKKQEYAQEEKLHSLFNDKGYWNYIFNTIKNSNFKAGSNLITILFATLFYLMFLTYLISKKAKYKTILIELTNNELVERKLPPKTKIFYKHGIPFCSPANWFNEPKDDNFFNKYMKFFIADYSKNEFRNNEIRKGETFNICILPTVHIKVGRFGSILIPTAKFFVQNALLSQEKNKTQILNVASNIASFIDRYSNKHHFMTSMERLLKTKKHGSFTFRKKLYWQVIYRPEEMIDSESKTIKNSIFYNRYGVQNELKDKIVALSESIDFFLLPNRVSTGMTINAIKDIKTIYKPDEENSSANAIISIHKIQNLLSNIYLEEAAFLNDKVKNSINPFMNQSKLNQMTRDWFSYGGSKTKRIIIFKDTASLDHLPIDAINFLKICLLRNIQLKGVTIEKIFQSDEYHSNEESELSSLDFLIYYKTRDSSIVFNSTNIISERTYSTAGEMLLELKIQAKVYWRKEVTQAYIDKFKFLDSLSDKFRIFENKLFLDDKQIEK